MRTLFPLLLTLFLMSGCSERFGATDLTCEYRQEPDAIETAFPALGWKIAADGRNIRQKAYRILVADSEKRLDNDDGNIWDSGEIESDRSVNISYNGKDLEEGRPYYWKVKVWSCKDGKASSWSKTSRWRQAPRNLKMNWISYSDPTDQRNSTASIWYRKDYNLPDLPGGPIYAEIATPGYYELYINGEKIGKDVLSPSVSGKDKRTFYVTYEISKYLHKGLNSIGIWTGRGWGGPAPVPVAFRCLFSPEDKKPAMETDSTWKARSSHYSTIGTWSHMRFGGECIDSRKNIPEWNRPGNDLSEWNRIQLSEAPSPRLEAQPCELNRREEFQPAKAITELDNKCFEIDFGKARTGDYRIFFPELKEGDTVFMHFADTRWHSKDYEDTPAGKIRTMGRIYSCKEKTFRYPTYNQSSMYIASGSKNECFESKFNPLAFRYIIVEGLKEAPVAAEAALVETDLTHTGEFWCDNGLFMKMHEINDWTMRCLNQGGLYVDCPQRERLGYGDGQVSAESSIMNYYMPSFYRKFIRDWALRQNKETGDMPHVAPNAGGGGGPAWAGLVAALTWRNYLYYEDTRTLEKIYPVMEHYLKSLEAKSPGNIYRSEKGKWNWIGDWLAPGRGMDTDNWPTKPMAEVFNNCYIIYLWDIQRKAAIALGKTEDAEFCSRKLDTLRPLVHKTFFDSTKFCYVSDEQSYLMMPLMAGVVPEDLEEQIWKKLEENINRRQSLQTGMLGTYFMINYLMEKDRNDLLFKMISHSRYPGWGYMLSQGATVWWEQWNGYFSQMHSVFTSLDSWFYQGIAGIRPINGHPGMKHFRIRPDFTLPLNSVRASTVSMYGKISSGWEKEKDGTLKFHVEIPANSSAEICFPVKDSNLITENGIPLDNIPEIKDKDIVEGRLCCTFPSGRYNFVIRSPRSPL